MSIQCLLSRIQNKIKLLNNVNKHYLSFLMTTKKPMTCSKYNHANWEETRSIHTHITRENVHVFVDTLFRNISQVINTST